MSAAPKSNNSMIETSAGYPLDPVRVGELPECVDTIRRAKELADEQVSQLNEIQGNGIEAVFKDTELLRDRKSQWYGYSSNRINDRQTWFEMSLSPAIDRDLKKLERLLIRFTVYWERYNLAVISEVGQAHIAQIKKIYDKMTISLGNNASLGPYRIGLVAECDEQLSMLDNEIETIGVAWRYKKIDHIAKEWFQTIPSEVESPQSNPQEEIPYRDNASLADTVTVLLEPLDHDLEHGMGNYGKTTSSRGVTWQVVLLVAVTLSFAVVYSIITHDVQTGFTIAGVLAALGSMLLYGVANGRQKRERERGLECEKLA